MQLLFSFDRGTRVRKLSCKFSLLNCHQLSCNSFSRLTGARELRKLSCKFSLLNCHQLSCNSCSRLTGARELRKLSCKFSLLNCHQLSCNSCSRLTGTRELRKLSCKFSLLNSHQLSDGIYYRITKKVLVILFIICSSLSWLCKMPNKMKINIVLIFAATCNAILFLGEEIKCV